MLLTNSIINLRALEPEDLDILYRWENAAGLWLHGNTLSPYSKFALKKYITETQLVDIYESKQLRLIIESVKNKTIIGVVDLYELDVRNSRAGVGILVGEEHRNNHYATQALDLMKNYAFNFLGLYQLYAYISANNTHSLRLFENAGYRLSGVLKNWILRDNTYEDVRIVQLLNDKYNERRD